MKKYIALLLTILMLILPACSSDTTADSVDVGPDPGEQTIDTRLDKLVDHGWTKNENNYTLDQEGDYSQVHLAVWLEENDLVIEVNYDYGDRNEEVQELYRDDETVLMGLAARWFADIEGITGEAFENMKYSVLVGGQDMGSGTIDESEALEFAEEYDD